MARDFTSNGAHSIKSIYNAANGEGGGGRNLFIYLYIKPFESFVFIKADEFGLRVLQENYIGTGSISIKAKEKNNFAFQ
jgi:hypothetical protein